MSYLNKMYRLDKFSISQERHCMITTCESELLATQSYPTKNNSH